MANIKVKDLAVTSTINTDNEIMVMTDDTNNIVQNITVENLLTNILSDNAKNVLVTGTDKKLYVKDIAAFIRVFPSAAALKADTDVRKNDVALTEGYYSSNDGGSALYIIRDKNVSDVEDNCTILFLQNDLVAEFILIDNKVNIKQFGAKGDNVTDDTAFFQAAINKKIKNIYVPSGNYMISSLTIPTSNGIKIYGDVGVFNTYLHQIAITNSHFIIVKDNATCFSLENLALIGHKADQLSSNDGIHFETGAVSTSTWAILNQIRIEDFSRYGMYIGVNRLSVHCEQVVVSSCTSTGIYCESADNYFLFCVSALNGGNGLSITGSSNNLVGGAFFSNNNNNINITNGGGNILQNFQNDQAKRNGIYIGSNYNIIEGVRFYGNGQAHIDNPGEGYHADITIEVGSGNIINGVDVVTPSHIGYFVRLIDTSKNIIDFEGNGTPLISNIALGNGTDNRVILNGRRWDNKTNLQATAVTAEVGTGVCYYKVVDNICIGYYSFTMQANHLASDGVKLFSGLPVPVVNFFPTNLCQQTLQAASESADPSNRRFLIYNNGDFMTNFQVFTTGDSFKGTFSYMLY